MSTNLPLQLSAILRRRFLQVAGTSAAGLFLGGGCENIFAPLIPRPAKPEGIDALDRRARESLELVIQGIQA